MVALPNAGGEVVFKGNVLYVRPWMASALVSWYRTGETRWGIVLRRLQTTSRGSSVPAERVLGHHGTRDLLRSRRVATAAPAAPAVPIVA